jgi:hypothetical protein
MGRTSAPSEWLERAQRLRQIAITMADPAVRQEILDVARRWAAMSERPVPPATPPSAAPKPDVTSAGEP